MNSFIRGLQAAFINPFLPPITGEHVGKTFVLDGRKVVDAKLVGCNLYYHGGDIHMCSSHLEDCGILLEREALNAAAFIAIVDAFQPGLQKMILDEAKQMVVENDAG